MNILPGIMSLFFMCGSILLFAGLAVSLEEKRNELDSTNKRLE